MKKILFIIFVLALTSCRIRTGIVVYVSESVTGNSRGDVKIQINQLGYVKNLTNTKLYVKTKDSVLLKKNIKTEKVGVNNSVLFRGNIKNNT